MLICSQRENADLEKEKEKQERIEASLREREREVRASQAELAKAREKEKEQHLRDKAEQHFNALLADMVRVLALMSIFTAFESTFMQKYISVEQSVRGILGLTSSNFL